MSGKHRSKNSEKTFTEIQLKSPLTTSTKGVIVTQLEGRPVYPINTTSTVYRERTTLSVGDNTREEVQKSTDYSSSDADYDTDLESDLPAKYCGPPSQNSVHSQQRFYETFCSKIGVVPISIYERSLNSRRCILNYRKITDTDSKALTLPLHVNGTISRLELKENLLSSVGAKWIAQLIRENTTLTELNLADNRGAFDKEDTLRNLCEALVANRTITELDLSGNRIDDRCGQVLRQLLQRNRSLRSLNLSHNELCSVGGQQIGLGLAVNEVLQALDLSWNHLRLEGTSQLAFSLRENVTLKKLFLAMNGFGMAGAMSLAMALRDNSSLLELDISNNRIPVEGAGQFGKIFSSNETLQILRMGQNPMQIHGAYALIRFIHDSHNCSLQVLDLQSVMVLDVFMDMVMKIKAFNPTFRVKVGTIVTSPTIKLETGSHKEISTENPLMIVVTYMESQRMRIVDLFKTWDADNSMSLTREEFKEGLKSINTPLTESQLDDLIQMLDGDGNGEIELSELIQAIERDHKGIRKKAAQAAKADGPFPKQGKEKNSDGPDNFLEEMEEMLREGEPPTLPYESALIEDNPHYRTPVRIRQTGKTPLTDGDFHF